MTNLALKQLKMTNNLQVKAGEDYVTQSGEIVAIIKQVKPFWIGYVCGVFNDAREWMDDGTNVGGDTDLDLKSERAPGQLPKIKIAIKDQKKYKEWEKTLCEDYESKDLNLWICTHRFAQLMEKKMLQGNDLAAIAEESAREAGLFEIGDGELSITMLYQCWTLGDELANIPDYRPYCF